jgi:glutamate racemase
LSASAQQPIGIFDSGIGGLTVARDIIKLLPAESIIYFGDTAHLPYGDKSQELIKSYSETITDFFLQKKKCKCVVIACNTASAVAYEYLRILHQHIPIINVIDPIVESVVTDNNIHHVGIIATKTTIASGVYQEKLFRRKPALNLSALATPLLAPMIEEGFYNNNISETVIHNYLKRPTLKNIDALILGCTHYVMIKNEINNYYGGKVKLFDSIDIVANKLKKILENEMLLNETKTHEHEFFVSDYTESFAKSAKAFYGENIILEKLNLWKKTST